MDNRFKYVDERDRCFGIAGMAISLVAWDAEKVLVSVSLDDGPDNSLVLDHEYFFEGNPGYSPKAAWNNILANFRLTTAITLGNLLCRSYMSLHKALPNDDLRCLIDLVRQTGADNCSLEPDECDGIFNQCYAHTDRLFAHRGVQQVASAFVDELSRRRRMSVAEVLDALADLRRL